MRMQFLAKYREGGLLMIRLALGVLFIILMGPVLLSGHSAWAHNGEAIRALGLHAHFQFWGFLGALLGCIGGALMIFGLFFRLGVLLVLLITLVHLLGIANYRSHLDAIELFVILLGILFVGPGKYSVDKN
jgi:putative oxidoreductase